ncbi:MAG: acetolactate synthase small subunit [Clostridiales bacterium]|nr:acetolactate synthase small subunit [Clostridiales bacterium]
MKKTVIAILVRNQAGVLTRVSALFSRRGFNIDSLTVSETESHAFSRITVTMEEDAYVKKQLMKQLGKLHDVREIEEMHADEAVFRELLLIKIKVTPGTRQEIMDATNVFRSKIIDFSADSLCVEITGESPKIDAFIELMRPLGIVEMCRTGVIALERGKDCLKTLE